jgi:hypothetical protein
MGKRMAVTKIGKNRNEKEQGQVLGHQRLCSESSIHRGRIRQGVTMSKRRVQKQYLHLPPPPRTPSWCAFEAGRITAQLIRKHNARKW